MFASQYRFACSASGGRNGNVGRRARRIVALAVVAVMFGASPVAAIWIPPIDAPVVDPFRPPETRYGSGNRGLEYGANVGQAFTAVDGGTVVYAGRVGRHRHITVDHGDGLRSTYAFVTTIDVVRGQRVRQGQRLGTAGPGFHLTARLGDVYVDPALLFAGYDVSLRLTESALPSTTGRRAPAALQRSLWDPLLAANAVDQEWSLTSQIANAGSAAKEWFHVECTSDGASITAQPADGRVLIQVGGLGSSTDEASIDDIDEAALGYGGDDVIRFSYAGLCPDVAETASVDAGVAPSPTSLADVLVQEEYVGEDTHQDVYVSAQNLADLIVAASVERPGQPIDVAAHSLGGVVTRLALEILEARGGPMPSVVVTIGSPHGGAGLGTAAQVGAGSPIGDVVEAIVGDVVGEGTAQADSVAQIAEGGVTHLDPPGPPPVGVDVVAIAGSTDLVVPADAAMWEGATNTIVPTAGSGVGAHGDLPGTWQVEREMALAIAGSPPRCVSLGEVLVAAGTSTAISTAEDGASILIGAARWLL